MAWIYLLIASILEIGWPLGLKLSQTTANKYFWIAFATVVMIGSGFFLWLAQKTIPMGTAYAVWTGIGAVGAFVTGIIIFNDSATMLRYISVIFVIIGIIGLKIST